MYYEKIKVGYLKGIGEMGGGIGNGLVVWYICGLGCVVEFSVDKVVIGGD